MSDQVTNSQISKLMQAFALTAKSYHVHNQVQAETALLIFYALCDNKGISKEQQDKLIKKMYTMFLKSKEERGL